MALGSLPEPGAVDWFITFSPPEKIKVVALRF